MFQDAPLTETATAATVATTKILTLNAEELKKIKERIKNEIEEENFNINLIEERLKLEDGGNGLPESGTLRVAFQGKERLLFDKYKSLEKLSKLREVRKKIKNGTWTNICSKCNKPISLQRLLWEPTTTICRKCACSNKE